MQRALEQVAAMLERSGHNDSPLPPTLLFNEGWMLRLVLDWASQHRDARRALRFADASVWRAEALLPSRFKPRYRGHAGEGFTHAECHTHQGLLVNAFHDNDGVACS